MKYFVVVVQYENIYYANMHCWCDDHTINCCEMPASEFGVMPSVFLCWCEDHTLWKE